MRFSTSTDTKPNYEAYLRKYSDTVNDCFAFLYDAVQQLADAHETDAPQNVAVLLLTCDVLECIDAVQILISHGSIPPCEGQLRSALESIFGIDYILKDNSKQRGLAYLVADYRKRLRYLRQFDPKEPIGKEIRQLNTPKQVTALTGTVPLKQLRESIAYMQAQLADPEFEPTNDEFDRQKGNKKYDPHWYSLYGGPGSVMSLARDLKLNYLYEFMYGPWSGTLHGGNTVRNLCDRTDEAIGYRPIRHPDGMNTILRATVVLIAPLAVKLFLAYSSLPKATVMTRHNNLCDKINPILETENVAWCE